MHHCVVEFLFFLLGLRNLQIADHNWGVGGERTGRCSQNLQSAISMALFNDLYRWTTAWVRIRPRNVQRGVTTVQGLPQHSNRQKVVANSCQACLTRPCSENNIDWG